MDAQNQSVRTDEDCLRALKTDTSGQKVRLRFWEFDHFLTCPVVGTCLTAAEQKQLTKKAGLLKKRQTPLKSMMKSMKPWLQVPRMENCCP